MPKIISREEMAEVALSEKKAPTVRLAVTNDGMPSKQVRYPVALNGGDWVSPAPTIKLAHVHGAQGDNVLLGQRGIAALPDESRPALLISYYYLKGFLDNQHRYRYRDWVMDSGAFSAHSMGIDIELQDYINFCKLLIETDPTLTEVYSLDVIGDWRAGVVNLEEMWRQGVPAIPCFHYGEPWELLRDLCAQYPKVALGGMVGQKVGPRDKWIGQCFSRQWPKKFHGFGLSGKPTVLRFPFHCITDEHEILTREGWKGREQIKEGDQVLAFNDGWSRWEPVLSKFDYDVENAPLVKMDNRTISARTTPNHRWRVYNVTKERWEWTTTDRFLNSDRIPRTATYDGPTEKVHEDWFVELFAWYWTEGHVKRRTKCYLPSIVITQSLTANSEKVEMIRSALKRSGEKYCESITHRNRPELKQVNDSIATFELYGKVRDKLLATRAEGSLPREKKIPLSFILELTKDQLELFIRVSVLADGSLDKRITTGNSFSIWQKGGKNIDEFRIACLLAGYSTSYYETTGGAGTNQVSNNFIIPKPCGRDVSYTNIRREETSHTGHLWCVYVPSGAFFTRCNQHIYVTGNSVDATNWEISACKYGQWKAFGNARVSVRGSKQNLRIEVEWYLELERLARDRWRKEMLLLESVAPTIRLAVIGSGRETNGGLMGEAE